MVIEVTITSVGINHNLLPPDRINEKNTVSLLGWLCLPPVHNLNLTKEVSDEPKPRDIL